MTFGKKLQEARRSAGLSQEQLAEILHMSRQAISKWETGESVPDVEKLREICGVFGVSADELLGLDGGGEKEKAAGDRGLKSAAGFNLRRRVFTAGWVTALVGAVMTVLEYLALVLIRNSEVERGLTHPGYGFVEDVMYYAGAEPMPAVFTVTRVVIIAGVITAALALAWPVWHKIREKIGGVGKR